MSHIICKRTQLLEVDIFGSVQFSFYQQKNKIEKENSSGGPRSRVITRPNLNENFCKNRDGNRWSDVGHKEVFSILIPQNISKLDKHSIFQKGKKKSQKVFFFS